jgi:hypothetical protein
VQADPGARGLGGGVYGDGANVQISDSRIYSNTIAGSDESLGGGLYTRISTLHLLHSAVYSNTVQSNLGGGGGLFASNYAGRPVRIEASAIYSNTAGGDGGGLLVDGGGEGAATRWAMSWSTPPFPATPRRAMAAASS